MTVPVLLDSFSTKQLDTLWPFGRDVSPNRVLSIPLGLVQLAAVGGYLFAVWKMAAGCKTRSAAALRVIAAALAMAGSFMAYVPFAFWLSAELMA